MKRCPHCKHECLSLHLEWRGIRFTSPLCPNCANQYAVQLIHDQAARETGQAAGK